MLIGTHLGPPNHGRLRAGVRQPCWALGLARHPSRSSVGWRRMEGSGTGATLGGLGRRAGALMLPIPGNAPSPTQHEVLQNSFKRLRNPWTAQ